METNRYNLNATDEQKTAKRRKAELRGDLKRKKKTGPAQEAEGGAARGDEDDDW